MIKKLILFAFSFLNFLIKNFFIIKSLIFRFVLNLPFLFKQVLLILAEKYFFFIDILFDNTILLYILKKIKTCYNFYNIEKENFLACIKEEQELIYIKCSNMKTFQDVLHIFFRHFFLPLFFFLGTFYIVGITVYALIGLTYEHFGYDYNGKFPFTKF